MGLFNEVTATTVCPGCAKTVTVRAQFRYGHTRQLAYTLGDQVKWGGDDQRPPPRRTNDVGIPGKRSVVVEAVARCGTCGYGSGPEEWSLYLYLRADRIVRLATADGTHDFLRAGDNYIVLEP